MAGGAGDGDRVSFPISIGLRLILRMRPEVLKATCHFDCLNYQTTFKSGKRNDVLWKNMSGLSDVERGGKEISAGGGSAPNEEGSTS